jgi:S-adenosylmethionine decarboxylase
MAATKTIREKGRRWQVFGYELLLDCYSCRPGTCDDLEHCYSYLDKMVEFIGMHKQAPPSIFRTDRKEFPTKTGLSGWVPLADSSIVIHTMTKRNFISIDVYSCKEYDPEKVISFTKKYFAPKRMEKNLLFRGVHYFDHREKGSSE